jgi:hypothetical protein
LATLLWWRRLLFDPTKRREIDATSTTAQLLGLDIEIVHGGSPRDVEQVSINPQAAPSFEVPLCRKRQAVGALGASGADGMAPVARSWPSRVPSLALTAAELCRI